MNESHGELPPIVVGEDVRRTLKRTPVAQWSGLAILLHLDGRPQIMSRGDLAGWLRANDLPTLATEALSRRVRRGELLMLNVRHDDAPPQFTVLFSRERTASAKPKHRGAEPTDEDRPRAPGVPRGRTAP